MFFGHERNSKNFIFFHSLIIEFLWFTYGSNSRERCTLRLFSKCLVRSTLLPTGVRFPQSFDTLFYSLRWAPFSLVLHLCSSKTIINGAKFIQKLIPDFKNHRNLDNFRQAVKSPKSRNSMGCICLKTTLFQLKHYIQKIYLTLLSTTCLKIHQIPHAIFETISYFSRHNSSISF